MNKNALTKTSNRNVVTMTGKIPDSFGMPSGRVSGGGVIRQLNRAELANQKRFLGN